MPVLFSESFTKSYYSPIFSISTLICLSLAIISFILPFFAAFATDEFWNNISSYQTHPTVKFNNQFILYILEDDETYFYSSVIKLNDFYEKIISVPLIKTVNMDVNSDNLIDNINMKIIFQSKPSKIQNIKLMLFFDYALNTMCLIDIDTPNGASYLNTNGNLELKQKSPISSGTIARTLYYTDIFRNSTAPFDFVGTYKEFQQRNLTTVYNYDKLVMPYRSSRETELDINIEIPSYQEVIFISPLLTTLKFAWIQYLSILIPCVIVCYFVLLFIFRYQIFETSVINDLPKNKIKSN